MRKLVLLFTLLNLVSYSFAQTIVVDAEAFKTSPNSFMGKTITIKNPTFLTKVPAQIESKTNTTTTTTNSAQNNSNNIQNNPYYYKVIGTVTTSISPSITETPNVYCTPMKALNLTKWQLSANNTICIQVQPSMLSSLPSEDNVKIKEVTFVVTTNMYLMTRCVIK